jgi:hypothetical protein
MPTVELSRQSSGENIAVSLLIREKHPAQRKAASIAQDQLVLEDEDGRLFERRETDSVSANPWGDSGSGRNSR